MYWNSQSTFLVIQKPLLENQKISKTGDTFWKTEEN